MEVLGCGVIHPFVLQQAKKQNNLGWAFGLGLERLAMKLFEIPDIRLFWSQDQRFLSQFSKEKGVSKFQSFSKFPACYKDISFWEPSNFVENDLFEIIRNIAGDLVENVKCIDTFKKKDQTSRCYRILYRSAERNLTNQEVDDLQFKIREVLTKLTYSLR